MSAGVLPLTSDFVFKLLFGDERNKSVLIGLLKTFVDLPREEYELTFIDPNLKPEFQEDKLGILDVKVKTKTGQIINIEIQVNPTRHIGKRLSFYKSKMIVGQIGKRQHYKRIQRVICVCITSKPLFAETKEYLNRFRFCNSETGLCFEAIPEEIYTVELSKVPATADGTALWEWVRFILARTEEEIEMLAERNAEIRKGADALYVLSANPEVRAKYEMAEKAWRDRASQLDDAFEGGMEKERGVWQAVVAGKDAEIAGMGATIERLLAQVAELQAKADD